MNKTLPPYVTSKKAMLRLQNEVIELHEDQVTLPDSIIDKWLAKRSSEQVVDILRQSRQTFYSYLTRGRAIYPDIDLLARELYRQSELAWPAKSGQGTRGPKEPSVAADCGRD